jgi:uncharacterized protein YhaN
MFQWLKRSKPWQEVECEQASRDVSVLMSAVSDLRQRVLELEHQVGRLSNEARHARFQERSR